MKNILLALVVANILYLMWGMYTEKTADPGVAFVEEADLGPPLDTTAVRDREGFSVGAVLGSGESSALEAVVGRACVSIGPFRESEDADSAALEYSNEGMKTALRQTREPVFVGHWVWIQNIADVAEGKAILAQLQAGGLGDAYLDRTEPDALKISLGLFGEVSGAEKIELQARSLDLPAEVIPSTRERDVHYVDIGLPPGKGFATIVAKYGEDRVLLRDAATCPQS